MDNVVVKSAIKNFVGELSVSGDFAEALNKEVATLIQKAVERAQANSRRTVMAKDL